VPTQTTPKVSEALSKFETDPNKKTKKDARDGSQELRKFLRWSGDREVGRFTPHDMEQYAKEVGQSGADSAQQRLQPVKAFVEYWKTQGWTDKKLATHLRPPRSKTRGTARASARPVPRPAEDEPTFLSQEGYDRIVQQLEDLKTDRVTVTQEIRKAMADKDFRENAPLDAAKERQGRIETQIRQLESTIASAQILSGSSNGGEIARSAVGTRITVKDKDSGEILDYTLVDAREADTGQRRISIQSPVGQALLDLGAGDEVAVPTPKGTLTYVVEGVTAA
jgi:transcription elongation factor GreA